MHMYMVAGIYSRFLFLKMFHMYMYVLATIYSIAFPTAVPHVNAVHHLFPFLFLQLLYMCMLAVNHSLSFPSAVLHVNIGCHLFPFFSPSSSTCMCTWSRSSSWSSWRWPFVGSSDLSPTLGALCLKIPPLLL